LGIHNKRLGGRGGTSQCKKLRRGLLQEVRHPLGRIADEDKAREKVRKKAKEEATQIMSHIYASAHS
jgi:hypothetical protein